MAEQPFHVPIYNYLPNNAFYNPHNVLGPNAENDDDEDDENEVIWTKKDGGICYNIDTICITRLIEVTESSNGLLSDHED